MRSESKWAHKVTARASDGIVNGNSKRGSACDIGQQAASACQLWLPRVSACGGNRSTACVVCVCTVVVKRFYCWMGTLRINCVFYFGSRLHIHLFNDKEKPHRFVLWLQTILQTKLGNSLIWMVSLWWACEQCACVCVCVFNIAVSTQWFPRHKLVKANHYRWTE